MSLLPANIPPETVPIGRTNDDGSITVAHNWWLFLYNVWQNSSQSGGTSVVDVLEIAAFASRVPLIPADPNPAQQILINQVFGS